VYDNESRELYGVAPIFTFNITGTYVVTLTVEDAEGETDTDTVIITVEEEEGEEQEDEKSFIESYGLVIGIVIALAVVALALFFILKGRKGGMAPTSMEEVPVGESEVHS
jgi:PKD repeat protein